MDRFIEEFKENYRPSHTYIFYDRPEIENMSPKEFVSYIDNLRKSSSKRDNHELELLIIRFIEVGKISDAARIFAPEEIKNVIQKGKVFKLSKNRGRAWREIYQKNEGIVGTTG